LGLYAAFFGWCMLSLAGILGLAHYANRPGEPADAPENWPVGPALERSTTTPTLVMLVHPQCTCSKASLNELERILARAGGENRVRTILVFAAPESMGREWIEDDLWRKAKSLPDVRVVQDPGSRLIQAFGAFTSGQTLLYDASGALIFKGGITGARAHEGDNTGRQAITSILQGRLPVSAETSVFGCSLVDRITSIFFYFSTI